MKKTLLIGLVGVLALTACNKKDTPVNESTPQTTQTQSTTQATPEASTPKQTSSSETHHDHAHDHHDHDHHNHSHGHHHNQGDAYQCGDKTIYIAIHEHDGEKEAHLTSDNITYDLNEDIQTKGRFTTDDGISGEDKGMALVVDGKTAKITTLDDQPLLECQKQ